MTENDTCYFIDKGNAESFFEQLEHLNEFVKQEWVEQGNLASLYERIGPRVLVILDNASYHKRQDIIDKIDLHYRTFTFAFCLLIAQISI